MNAPNYRTRPRDCNTPFATEGALALDRRREGGRVGGMKELLSVLLVGTLMGGCRGSGDDPSTDGNVSAAAPPVVEEWAEWEANPAPYGGPEVLAKIRKAKESNATQLSLFANKLSLRGNKIIDVTPLAGLTNLTELILWHNQISDLGPLARLTNLTKLNLYGNQITDLTPLAELKHLKDLTLPDNQITDLSPLAELTKLEELSLADNQIRDLTPLAGLTNLKYLNLSANPIPEGQIDLLEKSLPNCEIFY